MGILSITDEIQSRLNVLDLEFLKRFNFAVQIDGNNVLDPFIVGFNQVNGLRSAVDVREVIEGGYKGRYKFPRNALINAFELRKGLSFSRELWDWHQAALNWTKGKSSYLRTMTIFSLTQVNLGGVITFEVWAWDIYKAWPSAWVGPDFDSMTEEFAFESVTIEHSGISEAKGLFSGKAGEIISRII